MSLTPTHGANAPLIRVLDTNGDGTGNTNAVGNYLVPTQFFIKPPINTVLGLHEFHFSVTDSGGFNVAGYGNSAALINGIEVLALDRDGNVILDLTPPQNVFVNNDWAVLGYDISIINWSGNARTMIGHLAAGGFGTPFVIDGNKGQSLAVILQDDFTGLLAQSFVIKGLITN